MAPNRPWRRSSLAGLFRAKVFEVGDEVVVSVCDEELLGFTIADDRLGIEFRVGEPFYGGDLVDLDEALELIRRSTSANLVGNRIVEAAVESGLVSPDGILVIGGVKHVQIYLYREG